MIWCVEDDGNILDMELYTLESTGFMARGYRDGESFFADLSKELPELVMLDIMLPGEDGMEILKKLKQDDRTKDIPVIMATAKGMEIDKIQGLDLGADDYLVKPFGMMEMVSRIKAVLRRCGKKTQENVVRVENLTVSFDKYTASIAGEELQLTKKEFELLKLFLKNPGVVFTRDQLLYQVWGLDYCGETRTVDVHIRTLRQKLEEYGERIHTVRGVGYRWNE